MRRDKEAGSRSRSTSASPWRQTAGRNLAKPGKGDKVDQKAIEVASTFSEEGVFRNVKHAGKGPAQLPGSLRSRIEKMTEKNQYSARVAKVAGVLERLDADLRDLEATSSFADVARLIEKALSQALDEPLVHEVLETLNGRCSDILLKRLSPRPLSLLRH